MHLQPLPHTRSCFVCGEANPLGLRLRFESDGAIVRTRFTPRPEHNGFKGVVHGGITATVLDEIMVWACAVRTRKFAFCAVLNVRYLNPIKPGGEIILTGEMTADRKGRIYEARGTACDAGGLTLAEATGKYLPVKGVNLADLAADFVGDPAWLTSSPH